MMNEAEEKLKKAQIKLQSRNPFFAYLSLFLKFKKATKDNLPEHAGMGVSPDGTLTYKEDFVKGISDEETIGVLCHEIMHLSFLHLVRRGSREHLAWNIAVDLAVNQILLDNGFQVPKGGLIPTYNEYTCKPPMFKNQKKISNINGKTGEEIHDELPPLNIKYVDGDGGTGGFDHHQEEQDGKGAPNGAEKEELEREWLNRLEEAYVSAKSKGNLPAGLERYIEEIKKSQISWKVLLQKMVTASIPHDFTWAKKSKKSIATGIYLPSTIKEKIDVCVGIDLSGSIGKDELTEFMSEVIGIAKAFQNNIKIRLLTHDVDVHNDYEVTNGNIAKIKALKLTGGGGTSHEPIFEYVKEKVKDCKIVVFFTDGYSDIQGIDFKNYNFQKVFVINKHGSDDATKGRSDCVSIKMRDE